MGWPRITLPRRQARHAGTGQPEGGLAAEARFYGPGADPYGDGLNVAEALARMAPDAPALLTAPAFTPHAVPLTRPQAMYVPSAVPPRAARPVRPQPPAARRAPTEPVPVVPSAPRALARRAPGQPPVAPPRPPQHAQAPALSVLSRVGTALRRKVLGSPLDPTPVGDQAEAEHQPAGRMPQISERRATAAEVRLARVPYPQPGGTYGDDFWVRIDTITGTTGPRRMPRADEQDGGGAACGQASAATSTDQDIAAVTGDGTEGGTE
jgi:hypothetical protein